MEGYLFVKAEGKKAWKKHWFVLRASGLYFSSKGRSSKGSSRDLVCLATFDANQVNNPSVLTKAYVILVYKWINRIRLLVMLAPESSGDAFNPYSDNNIGLILNYNAIFND
jgi:hypothetical protein